MMTTGGKPIPKNHGFLEIMAPAGNFESLKSAIYNGADEVFIKDSGSNQAFKLNQYVTIRESLIYELETILDKSCIFVQE